MTMPNGATTTPAPPAGKGDEPIGGDTGGTTPKTLTEEEHDRRMRGKATEVERANKALEAANNKLAAIEAAAKKREENALAEQGQHKELAEQRARELAEASAERDALRAEKTAREETLTAANRARIKELPEELKKGIPSGLAPDALATHLTWVESLQSDSGGAGIFSGGPRPRTGSQSAEEVLEQGNKALADAMLGRLAPADRGVRR